MTPALSAVCDVAIVGAGPVGLTLACKLAQAGLSVTCLEENAGLHAFPRAVGLDDEALRTFQGIGLHESDLAPCLMNCAGITYYGERGQFLARIHPKETPYGHYKGASFYQPHLENLLLERARALGVSVLFGHKVVALEQDAGEVVLQAEHEGRRVSAIARYAVGCDGSRSFVRKSLGIGLKGTTFEQKWLIVDTENDVRPERYAEVWCCSRRPTVTIPRRQGYRRWEFMLKPGETEADFDTFDKVRPLLEQHVKVEDIRIDRFNVYTFHSRVADSYRSGRVFLAGDACHLIPPFMAQGMAAGIRDADNLGWKLAGVLKGRLDPRVFSSYEQERKPHLLAMGKLSEQAGALMMPQTRWRSHAKDVLVSALCRIPGVMSAIEEARMRPGPAYAQGLFRLEGAKDAAGHMFPQPRVRDEAGKEALLDEFLGEGFSLVYMGSTEQALDAGLSRALQQLGCQIVQVVPQGLMVDARFQRLAGVTLVEDIHNAIPSWRRESHGQAYLLRPDRYVAGQFRLRAQAGVQAWLERELMGAVARTTAPAAVPAFS